MFYVGIDIAKRKHDIAVFNDKGELLDFIKSHINQSLPLSQYPIAICLLIIGYHKNGAN